ncbi:MAG: aldo/keto reductase [Rhodospirillales bacterium]|nr:aldo/keto reductase [Rhodospirillales bacterium]MBO6788287.1 aldo/keto reductase [Rhodospirillales bacterium]
MSRLSIDRRRFIGTAAAGTALGLGGGFGAWPSLAAGPDILTKPIPKSAERIPAIGMGTWITFNVGEDKKLRDARTDVLAKFFELGGGMIDSSPMYGSAEEVVGYGLDKLGRTDGLFSATKVWTPSTDHGRGQIDDSFRLWGVKTIDLFQVHNLLNWEDHLQTLRAEKSAGRIRYIGITTSHGMRHGGMEKIMQTEDIDFVQLTYNAVDRNAEARLLPLAAERGIAVICNRPYRRSSLIDHVQSHPLPPWAADAGAGNWPEFLLKFIISHPAVTCAIPATSKVEHMTENMNAMRGQMPDQKMRQRMAEYVGDL